MRPSSPRRSLALDPTTILAVWGAVTGTVGAIGVLKTRVDARWARRGKIAPEVRPALTALHDVLAEVRVRPQQATSLRTPRMQVQLQVINEASTRATDWRLRRQLRQFYVACSVVAGGASDASSLTSAKADEVEAALAAVRRTRKRLDRIERRAPA